MNKDDIKIGDLIKSYAGNIGIVVKISNKGDYWIRVVVPASKETCLSRKILEKYRVNICAAIKLNK